MSREFNGSSQYLEGVGVPVAAPPLTMACWFQPDNITTHNTLMSISDFDQNNIYFGMEAVGVLGGDPIRAIARLGGTTGIALTASPYVANVWNHACAVFTNSTDRDVYIDGAGVNNTDAVTPGETMSHIGIGVRNQNNGFDQYMDGEIAEAAIWNAALTAEEVAILAAGYSPLLVRPQSLVLYTPLVREIHDIVGRIGVINTGTTVGDHPVIITPASPQLVPATAAVPPLLAIASQRLKIGVGR